jgi:hypothetical protein
MLIDETALAAVGVLLPHATPNNDEPSTNTIAISGRIVMTLSPTAASASLAGHERSDVEAVAEVLTECDKTKACGRRRDGLPPATQPLVPFQRGGLVSISARLVRRLSEGDIR